MDEHDGESPLADGRVTTDEPLAGGGAPDVYGATVDRYTAFSGTILSEAVETSTDLEALGRFVDGTADGATVVDLGAGVGRASAWIAARAGRRDITPWAIEPSPVMVMAARRIHPWLRCDVGWADAVPSTDSAVDAVVAWYSIIHTPAEGLAAIWAELARVLRPGGRVLLAFASGGGEVVRRDDVGGSGLALVAHRHRVDTVTDGLASVGFVVGDVVSRPAAHPHEDGPQTIVTAVLGPG